MGYLECNKQSMAIKIKTLSGYFHEYQKSITDPLAYWDQQAESFYWRKRWTSILEYNFDEPKIEWFKNGKLNITENIFERHLYIRKDQTAIIWEPNNPEEQAINITYGELFIKVKTFANALISIGIKKGDRVAIYMPMIPELAVAMLACARIGAIHSVVFAGFSATSLVDRINDSQAKLVITSDEAFRGHKTIPIKEVVDEALKLCTSVEHVIVKKRTGGKVNFQTGRDLWWDELILNKSSENTAEEMDSEDPLFTIYTSGSTGKPKGLVHTTGGYMVYSSYTFLNVFQYQEGDVFF